MANTYNTQPISHRSVFKEWVNRHYSAGTIICETHAHSISGLVFYVYSKEVWFEKPNFLTKKKRKSFDPFSRRGKSPNRNGPSKFRSRCVNRPTRRAWRRWEHKILTSDIEEWDQPRTIVDKVPYYY